MYVNAHGKNWGLATEEVVACTKLRVEGPLKDRQNLQELSPYDHPYGRKLSGIVLMTSQSTPLITTSDVLVPSFRWCPYRCLEKCASPLYIIREFPDSAGRNTTAEICTMCFEALEDN
uniref:Uncharacterized protein n=1 Tax=Romanomermis culicivorax TaxID=13658 RepID=A0A915HW83_ROMCU